MTDEIPQQTPPDEPAEQPTSSDRSPSEPAPPSQESEMATPETAEIKIEEIKTPIDLPAQAGEPKTPTGEVEIPTGKAATEEVAAAPAVETKPTPAPLSPEPAQPSFTEVPEDKPATPAKEDLSSEVPHPPTGGGTKEDDFNTRFKAKLKELRDIANQKRLKKTKENEEKIMAFALEHNRINNKDARKITGLSDDRTRYYLDKLEKEGKLTQFGSRGPKVFYMPTK